MPGPPPSAISTDTDGRGERLPISSRATSRGGSSRAPGDAAARWRAMYKWPDDLIKCGELLGVKLPEKGDVPDVEILWFPGRLTDFGSVSPTLATGGLR